MTLSGSQHIIDEVLPRFAEMIQVARGVTM
jgi:hypothetical protein